MDMSTSAQRKLADATQRGRVGDLLERYPDVSASEVAEILRFLKNGPALEVALMTTEDRLQAQLDRFRADHRAEFDLGPRQYLTVAFIVSALVLLSFLGFDAGTG